ncbi:glycosyltransferase family 2 protein [Paenibacillus elgii]|uniref:glycosyltransferase family 2 protein n=1 Tax=Paenibacillus elgii TaxID=189691 RepID=UPI000248D5D3|nr:glycosyltransferase family 2 protein [Paenibacillus elgii]
MAPLISVIIPAWNESRLLASTLEAVSKAHASAAFSFDMQLIVVDDGSRDGTGDVACAWADVVLRFPVNSGKGAAMYAGWQAASGEIVVFLDADLGSTAEKFPLLLEPVLRGEADLTVAKLPPASIPGGFGLVRGLAGRGVRLLSGYDSGAPLSGQRAMRSEVLRRCERKYQGFGAEVGMMVDAVKLGFRIVELEVPFRHRETGRTWQGWIHRGKQLCEVGLTLWQCWRKPAC